MFTIIGERLELYPFPPVAKWRQDVTLAEIQAALPPWLTVTAEDFAARKKVFLGLYDTGPIWWFKAPIKPNGPPPCPNHPDFRNKKEDSNA